MMRGCRHSSTRVAHGFCSDRSHTAKNSSDKITNFVVVAPLHRPQSRRCLVTKPWLSHRHISSRYYPQAPSTRCTDTRGHAIAIRRLQLSPTCSTCPLATNIGYQGGSKQALNRLEISPVQESLANTPRILMQNVLDAVH